MKKIIIFSTLIVATEVISAADITVIGSKQAEKKLQGSGTYIESKQIQENVSGDVNRLLRQVPGVYIREEDGLGLFPNISLRGVDPNRSSKVNLMEDGVLVAPAPYSSPAAYFFPNVDRMSAVEVLKGSSQVKYGPQSTGGVINFTSFRPPSEKNSRDTRIRTSFGNFNDQKIHLLHGQKFEGFSYQIDLYSREHDGFKRLDLVNDDPQTGNTGMERLEPQLFLSYETQSGLYQKFDLKYGITYLDANETYLGLAEQDFQDSPYRRYNSTRFDRFDSQQTQSYLRHFIEFSDNVSLKSTLYQNKFERVWYKLDKVNGNNLGPALADSSLLPVLRGEAAGTLTVRNNDREYDSYGLDEVLDLKTNIGEWKSHTQVGLRIHHDYMISRNYNDDFTVDASGVVTDVSRGTPGNSKDSADAVSTYIENTFEKGKFSITPGIRRESVNFTRENRETNTKDSKRVSVFTYGVGMNYQASESASYFLGAFRGTSLPGPGDAINLNIKPETSNSFELGTTHSYKNWSVQSTLFHTVFKDLYVPANLITGSEVSENAGDIASSGLELQLNYQLDKTFISGFRQLFHLNSTLTRSELLKDANSQSGGSFFAGGKKGNKTAYIPEVLVGLGTTLTSDKISFNVMANYTSGTWSTAGNQDLSAQDVRVGRIPAFFTVDARIAYQISSSTNINLNAINLTNEQYMVSRHAYGPRPGRPLSVIAGLETVF